MPGARGNTKKELYDLLKWIFRNYAPDPDRVYLTGFSNGGIGTCRFASLHPDRFAAVAALEGYSKPPGDERGVETEMMLNLKNTPVFIIHGDRDQVISIEPDRILADFLQRNAIPFRLPPTPVSSSRPRSGRPRRERDISKLS